MDKRKAFRIFTVVLCAVCIWTAYANVFSDDTAVRAQAKAAIEKEAACGDKCKVVGMRAERNMLGTSVEMTIDGKGMYVAICRRAAIVAGDYTCSVSKG